MSLMESHHDTTFSSIMHDDSLSITSRIHIPSLLGKGRGIWLIAQSSLLLLSTSHIPHLSQECAFD
ncbi:hypothetical protein Mapa_001347 [Marchantia paleacea]|nr:hypothetical protein Mapa_001347 [Marchantia paleacea]